MQLISGPPTLKPNTFTDKLPKWYIKGSIELIAVNGFLRSVGIEVIYGGGGWVSSGCKNMAWTCERLIQVAPSGFTASSFH